MWLKISVAHNSVQVGILNTKLPNFYKYDKITSN